MTTFNSVQYLTIDSGSDGQRIDNFLFKTLKDIPKSHIYQLLRKGEIRVNKKRVKPDSRLKLDDILRLPPIRFIPTTERTEPLISKDLVDQLSERIIYEDEFVLVLNKPSGLSVHAGSGIMLGIAEILKRQHAHRGFLELVHRLDRETSGCLLFAKSRPILLDLHRQWRENKVVKHYTALLVGRTAGGSDFVVDEAIARSKTSSGERLMKVDDSGLASKTVFRVLKKFKHYTLVQAEPETGRTHQIRVHAAHVGHPIIGDDKYGDYERNKKVREQGFKRLFLHASLLKFTLPEYVEALQFRAPLDPELEAFVERCRDE